VLSEQIDEPGDVVFRHACKLGLEGIVSKRLGSPYRSGRSRHSVKMKNPAAPAVTTGGRGGLEQKEMTVGSAYEGTNVDNPQELLNFSRHHCQAIQTIID
jgi:ATP-dependent DNA ligase